MARKTRRPARRTSASGGSRSASASRSASKGGTGPARRDKRARLESAAAGITRDVAPLFEDDASAIVPNEVIVQLRDDAAAQVTENIPTGPSRGMDIIGANRFGISALDAVLDAANIVSITRLHPPAPPTATMAMRELQLSSTFRIRVEDSTSEDLAAQFADLAEVEFAEPVVYRETGVVPNDPSFAAQWGLTKINCPAAWDRTTGSANVTVAVLDTGIDLDHPELAPLLVPGFDMVDLGPNPTPPAGFRFEGDFAGRDNDPQDEVGHGTHVAGTVACVSNNASGVAGVTWSCRLMPVKVLTRIVNLNNPNDVRGVGSSADIAAGIRWAVDNGARVLNLSLSGPTNTQVERDAVAYAISRGAVVVAAMGNNGGQIVRFPAAFPDVVAVGAINQNDQRANFSNTGPHIDVAAPGVGVLSTVWNNGFATFDGTSMASPHVAGVAALILSCNPNLTGAQVADIIRTTARPLRVNPGDPVPNDTFGHGCVDAAAAINRACPRPPTREITCQSRITLCPTAQVVCTSRRPSCGVSRVTVCPTVVVQCTQPIQCQRSVILDCPRPTRPPICQAPSEAIRCPTGALCGGPIPGPGGEQAGGGNDPWSTYGFDPYDPNLFDPYGTDYGDDPDQE